MKNQSLNLLKGISCLIVVFLHCRFPGLVGDGIIYGLRFSVPVFFMVSGYFSFGKPDAWIVGHMGKLVRMALVFELLHGSVLVLVRCVAEGDSLAELAAGLPLVQHPLRTPFFGVVCNGSLWYLYAMFWTWGILCLLRKRNWGARAYWLIPGLLALHIFGRYYCQNHLDIEQYVYLFRSAPLFGLPFVLLGLWIAEHEASLKRVLSAGKCVLLVLIGHVLIVVEFVLSGQYMDLHVSTVVIAFGLFLFAILRPDLGCCGWLSWLGGRYSMWIYLLHFPLIEAVSELGKLAAVDGTLLFGWLRPVAVCVLSILLAAGFDVCARKRRFKTKKI